MRSLLNGFDAALHLSDPDPVRRAQMQMRAPLPKRSYQAVAVVQGDDGFRVALDGKIALTPARAPIALPTLAAARLIAAEFDAQQGVIDPVTMPTMRLANTAIDGVARAADGVRDDIAGFAASDLLCYRAGSPEGLVARQNEAWDPLLEWASTALGARFRLAEGVMHVAQPPEAIARITHYLGFCSEPMRLAALHLMTTLTGSAILAIALDARAVSGEDGWTAAHVDEDWQMAHWGQDAEAVARRLARRRDFDAAVDVIEALDQVG